MPFKELSQAELNSEHFKALRESPQYYMECYASYMREVNPIPEIEIPVELDNEEILERINGIEAELAMLKTQRNQSRDYF